MRKAPLISLIVLGMLLGLMGALQTYPVRAQTMSITIQNFSFQPATVTVPAGTTVTWTNMDSTTHTSTSDTGAWDSGSIPQGHSFSFTFTQVGTFPYHCAIHPNMHGTVIVQAAATAAPTATATPSSVSVATATSVPLAAYPVKVQPVRSRDAMGPMMMVRRVAWQGYYDAHKDTYVSTDVSTKAMATAMHINFSAALRQVPLSSAPAIYLVSGRAATGQLAVFGSEPGESDYSPIWHEVSVQWKAGVQPVTLTSDNQIIALAKKGKLTMHATHIMLNCPIINVAH